MSMNVRRGGDWYNGRRLEMWETVVTDERYDPSRMVGQVEHEVTEVAEPDMDGYIDFDLDQ